jgi:hypothetical protein
MIMRFEPGADFDAIADLPMQPRESQLQVLHLAQQIPAEDQK